MNSKLLLIGSLSVLAIMVLFFASDSNDNSTSHVPTNLEPYDYEDVCGFPVTDDMRLDAIYENAIFSHDKIPFLTLRPGNFTHVELAQYYDHIYPSLQYWFVLKNGQQVYFKIGACDVDGSNISLGKPDPNYFKLKQPSGENNFETMSAPGFPLINTDTMQPVLDVENCKKTAEYYTKLRSDVMFTRENTTFDPIWKDQVFPLMDYCTDIGKYEKLQSEDGKISWKFQLENEN